MGHMRSVAELAMSSRRRRRNQRDEDDRHQDDEIVVKPAGLPPLDDHVGCLIAASWIKRTEYLSRTRWPTDRQTPTGLNRPEPYSDLSTVFGSNRDARHA